MNNKICVLITGLENLGGIHAMQLQEFYSIKKYPSLKTSYYVDFDVEIGGAEDTINPTKNLAELLMFLGMRGYVYRFDSYSGVDSQVNYRIHIIKVQTIISIPRIKPY